MKLSKQKMASNSDMFGYVLPSKRRKCDITDTILEKCSEKIDTVLFSANIETEIINKKG